MIFKMQEVGFYTDVEFGKLQVAGDEAHGFRPYQLLVSSIAVCSGGTLRKVLEKKRMEVEDITIKTEVERNEAHANRVEKVYIHYVIKGKDLAEQKIQRSIEVAHRNCPIAQSVKGSIDIIETFEIVDA
ncbi:OsmC family protein [Fredinandcohnia onubensis]|uniref:OsmC family protein n=1 Tax=Fredinandcohnia onubensis TaxID=1571209 RepID=UPI000C0BC49C|nr:OsmC family protein [Fredinandcohnia onubensis]